MAGLPAIYRHDLSQIHHEGFGFHADNCAPGVLGLLQPVLARRGTVLEIGCGSGQLTRHLVDAGHRVIATDPSPAFLDLVRDVVPDVEEVRRLAVPDAPLPSNDAVVCTGHPLNYLPDEATVLRALDQIVGSLRPGGILAVDICGTDYGERRRNAPNYSRVTDDWAIFTRFSLPSPDHLVRDITTFLRTEDNIWRRDDEVHDSVMIDVDILPGFLADRGVDAVVGTSFGGEELPPGLSTVVGRRHD